MTYWEVMFLWGLIPVGILGVMASTAMDYYNNGDYAPFFAIIAGYLVGGMAASTVVDTNTPTVKTAWVPRTVVMSSIINNKLVLVTDSGETLTFSDHEAFVKWENKVPIATGYYYKKVKFGLDANWSNTNFVE